MQQDIQNASQASNKRFNLRDRKNGTPNKKFGEYLYNNQIDEAILEKEAVMEQDDDELSGRQGEEGFDYS